MITTKAQEIKALETIKEILDNLGENSYITTAFDGCIEIAEENIEYDFAGSMKEMYENAVIDSQNLQQTNAEQSEEIKRLKNEIHSLENRLDKELEWKPYTESNNVSQEEYEHLAKDSTSRFLSEEEAKDLLYDWFGFAKEKVKIINSVNVYEINRHGYLRKVGTIERKPVYNATDWNYIRFNCGYGAYELWNGNIGLFSD